MINSYTAMIKWKKFAVKLNRANSFIPKIRNYVNTKTLTNIYFVKFDYHLSCLCIIWAQNINIFRRFITLQKKSWNNKFQKLVISLKPTFFANNILKFGDKATLEEIRFVIKLINRQVSSAFYHWFPFSWKLFRYETRWSVTDHVNNLSFWTTTYGYFSIRASTISYWHSTQDLLLRTLSLKILTRKSIKHFLTKYFIERY